MNSDDIDKATDTKVMGEMVVVPKDSERHLNLDEAANLAAGSDHYRAYVGPPDRFDFMGATQFALLFQLGLRDYHTVLDFGCGSLRLGKLLIPYLQPYKYFGIDPNKWLIDDGFTHELGRDILGLKHPRFSHNTDFNCHIFNESFDFIMAQSILTHTGLDLFEAFLKSAKEAMSDTGIILFTYFPVLDPPYKRPLNGWHYPQCVGYEQPIVDELVNSIGLFGKALPWYHQISKWYVAAKNPAQLPKYQHLHHLSGAVLRSDQFAESLTAF